MPRAFGVRPRSSVSLAVRVLVPVASVAPGLQVHTNLAFMNTPSHLILPHNPAKYKENAAMSSADLARPNGRIPGHPAFESLRLAAFVFPQSQDPTSAEAEIEAFPLGPRTEVEAVPRAFGVRPRRSVSLAVRVLVPVASVDNNDWSSEDVLWPPVTKSKSRITHHHCGQSFGKLTPFSADQGRIITTAISLVWPLARASFAVPVYA